MVASSVGIARRRIPTKSSRLLSATGANWPQKYPSLNWSLLLRLFFKCGPPWNPCASSGVVLDQAVPEVKHVPPPAWGHGICAIGDLTTCIMNGLGIEAIEGFAGQFPARFVLFWSPLGVSDRLPDGAMTERERENKKKTEVLSGSSSDRTSTPVVTCS